MRRHQIGLLGFFAGVGVGCDRVNKGEAEAIFEASLLVSTEICNEAIVALETGEGWNVEEADEGWTLEQTLTEGSTWNGIVMVSGTGDFSEDSEDLDLTISLANVDVDGLVMDGIIVFGMSVSATPSTGAFTMLETVTGNLSVGGEARGEAGLDYSITVIYDPDTGAAVAMDGEVAEYDVEELREIEGEIVGE